MANTHSLDLESSSSQYGSVSDSASLSVTGDLTLMAWVKLESLPSSIGNNYAVISKLVTTANRSYRMFIGADDKPYILISSDGATATTGAANTALTSNTWTHLAMVYTAASGQCLHYQNGTINGTNTSLPTSIFDGTAPLLIGAVDPTPIQFYDGLVKDVRIYSEALSAGSVANSYQKELVGNEANLQACYPFNNSAVDITANANNLTLVNSPVYSPDIPYGRASSGLQNKYW